jgi:hypothetical protein
MLPEDIKSYGTGVLHTYPAGQTMTLRECARYLIRESDNTAWKMLNRRLGVARGQDELESMGRATLPTGGRTPPPGRRIADAREDFRPPLHLRGVFAGDALLHDGDFLRGSHPGGAPRRRAGGAQDRRPRRQLPQACRRYSKTSLRRVLSGRGVETPSLAPRGGAAMGGGARRGGVRVRYPPWQRTPRENPAGHPPTRRVSEDQTAALLGATRRRRAPWI